VCPEVPRRVMGKSGKMFNPQAARSGIKHTPNKIQPPNCQIIILKRCRKVINDISKTHIDFSRPPNSAFKIGGGLIAVTTIVFKF
jgi:hypothetical protein